MGNEIEKDYLSSILQLAGFFVMIFVILALSM